MANAFAVELKDGRITGRGNLKGEPVRVVEEYIIIAENRRTARVHIAYTAYPEAGGKDPLAYLILCNRPFEPENLYRCTGPVSLNQICLDCLRRKMGARRYWSAKYPGKCAACGGKIAVGELVQWAEDGRKAVQHIICPQQDIAGKISQAGALLAQLLGGIGKGGSDTPAEGATPSPPKPRRLSTEFGAELLGVFPLSEIEPYRKPVRPSSGTLVSLVLPEARMSHVWEDDGTIAFRMQELAKPILEQLLAENPDLKWDDEAEAQYYALRIEEKPYLNRTGEIRLAAFVERRPCSSQYRDLLVLRGLANPATGIYQIGWSNPKVTTSTFAAYRASLPKVPDAFRRYYAELAALQRVEPKVIDEHFSASALGVLTWPELSRVRKALYNPKTGKFTGWELDHHQRADEILEILAARSEPLLQEALATGRIEVVSAESISVIPEKLLVLLRLTGYAERQGRKCLLGVLLRSNGCADWALQVNNRVGYLMGALDAEGRYQIGWAHFDPEAEAFRPAASLDELLAAAEKVSPKSGGDLAPEAAAVARTLLTIGWQELHRLEGNMACFYLYDTASRSIGADSFLQERVWRIQQEQARSAAARYGISPDEEKGESVSTFLTARKVFALRSASRK